MKKLKGQGTVTKWLGSKLATSNKNKFSEFISIQGNLNTLINSLEKKPAIKLELVSFSSSNDFSEQILSILSFVRYVGVPDFWTVYSDGTHTSEQIELLESAFMFSKIVTTDLNKLTTQDNIKHSLLPYKEHLIDYAKNHPLGKRLLIYLNHEIKSSTLFLDSDILFYEKASILETILKEKVNGWYLPDSNWGCLDSRYIKNNTSQLYQVNAGFILLNKDLSTLSEGLEFLKDLDNSYEYFSEQTVMHIILRANCFFPLDPRIFILDNSDQFDISYLYERENIAIRHYTGPVRHKMWQRDWKWHLSLS